MWHFLKDCENSTYSVERAVVYSEDSFLAMCASAPLSWRNTLGMSCSSGSETEFCPGSPCGITFAPLMAPPGEDVSTSCVEVSPARTSAPPAKVQESKENGLACGLSSPEYWAKFDHSSRSLKTPLSSLFEGLTESCPILPRWGSWDLTGLSGRTTPALPTTETVSGSWPTPCKRDYRSPRCKNPMHRDSPGLEVIVYMAEGQPTGGQLNPEWVAWLMGWPIGWASLNPLGMARFQKWLHSHGAPSTAA